MSTPLITVAAIISLAIFFVLLPLVIHTFRYYRPRRALKCPETGGLAEVDVDAPRAAFSSAFGNPLLRVRNCTFWPKRRGCGQGCIKPSQRYR